MWDFIYRSIVVPVERLNHHQMALLVMVIVFVGIWCMRGFGSRSSY